MLTWSEYVKILVAFFFIINPVGAVPVFVSLTAKQSHTQRLRTARTTSLAVVLVLAVSALVGEYLLQFFGISIHSFQVGGGILLLMMALAMVQARAIPAKQTPEEAEEATDRATVAVVPLAIPLLAGPGGISTAIIYSHAAPGLLHMGLILLICAVIGLAVLAALLLANPIVHLLGKTGINIATRLMGLLLASISIEFITGGLAVLLPGLAE